MQHKEKIAVTNQPPMEETENRSWKEDCVRPFLLMANFAKVLPLPACLTVSADGAHMTSPAAVASSVGATTIG